MKKDEAIMRVGQLKTTIERDLATGVDSGSAICPACGHHGGWERETGGWFFLCEECGIAAQGEFARSKTLN